MGWYKLGLEEIYEKLKTSKNGLAQGEVEERLQQCGPNKLPEESQQADDLSPPVCQPTDIHAHRSRRGHGSFAVAPLRKSSPSSSARCSRSSPKDSLVP